MLAVIDAVEVELPRATRAINSRRDRDAIANLPAEALGCGSARDRALAVLEEVRPLDVGDHQLGNDLALILGANHDLRKKNILVLIGASTPGVVRDWWKALASDCSV